MRRGRRGQGITGAGSTYSVNISPANPDGQQVFYWLFDAEPTGTNALTGEQVQRQVEERPGLLLDEEVVDPNPQADSSYPDPMVGAR